MLLLRMFACLSDFEVHVFWWCCCLAAMLKRRRGYPDDNVSRPARHIRGAGTASLLLITAYQSRCLWDILGDRNWYGSDGNQLRNIFPPWKMEAKEDLI